MRLLSAAERRGTPVLLSASVFDNLGNSPQIAALRRSREIDQSTQLFHVGCDNLWRIAWTGIFRQNFNDSNFNKSSSFCNVVCGKDTSIGAAIFILTLNHADVIGDPIRCGDTKCLVSLRALCCHLWRDININANRGRVLGKVSCYQESTVGRVI